MAPPSRQTQISGIGLTSGQSGINYNFGDYKPVTLGGMVYVDANGTAPSIAGDAGAQGVTITLSGTNGLGQTVTATTTTGSEGTYSFSTDSNGHQLVRAPTRSPRRSRAAISPALLRLALSTAAATAWLPWAMSVRSS